MLIKCYEYLTQTSKFSRIQESQNYIEELFIHYYGIMLKKSSKNYFLKKITVQIK